MEVHLAYELVHIREMEILKIREERKMPENKNAFRIQYLKRQLREMQAENLLSPEAIEALKQDIKRLEEQDISEEAHFLVE